MSQTRMLHPIHCEASFFFEDIFFNFMSLTTSTVFDIELLDGVMDGQVYTRATVFRTAHDIEPF